MARSHVPEILHPALRSLQIHYSFLNIFHHFTRLPCFLVPAENRSNWMPLVSFPHVESPVGFEFDYGLGEERGAYLEQMFDKAAREKRTVCAKRSGFHDITVPVVWKGKCIAFVYTGVLLQEVPSREDLVRQWTEWTGVPPAGGHGDFRIFVRRVLETPVLPPKVFKAHRELMEILAHSIAGKGKSVHWLTRIEQLKNKVFAPALQHDFWMRMVVGPPNQTINIFWKDGVVAEWETLEIGIRRPPTTALAMAPLDGPDAAVLDETERLLRARRIQLESVPLARRFPETVAGNLEDMGVLFLTSSDPSKSAIQGRLEIRERVRQIASFLKKRFGVRMVTGIGRSVRSGEYLGLSHREALLALQWCQYLDRDVLFHDEHPEKEPEVHFTDLRVLSRHLVWAVGRGSRLGMDLALDRFLKGVLWFSGRRPETVRILLWNALADLRELAERRQPMGETRWAERFAEMEDGLKETRSIQVLLQRFRESISSLSALARKPAQGSREVRIQWALQHLRKHFRDPLTQARLAAQAGFSPRVFSRMIYEETGRNFNDLLRTLRAEEARRLLQGGSMGLDHIAQECGFSSTSYLVRSFKRVYGMPPDQYRRRKTRS